MKTFFIMGLPRSGTAWLSNFLTWGESFCFHEVTFGCASMDSIRQAFANVQQPIVGTVDTAAILFYKQLHKQFPESKFLFIVRDKAAVKRSLEEQGFDVDGLDLLGDALGHAIRDEEIDGATVPFESLFNQMGMRQVWDFLEMPGPFPWQRFELLREMNVQDTARFRPDTQEAEDKITMNMEMFGRLMTSLAPKTVSWG